MDQLSALKDHIPNDTQLKADTVIVRPANSDILDSCTHFGKVCLKWNQ